MLIDGHYRLRALKVAQIKTINLDVQQYTSEIELYHLSWSYNNERSSQSTLDNAIAWKRLLDENVVVEADQIAKITGQTKANISKTMALLKLPQRALDRVSLYPDKIGIAVGYELSLCAKVMTEDELVKFVNSAIEENYSSRAIERHRLDLQFGKKRKARDMNSCYEVESKEIQGLMKEWESGRITLDIQISDPVQRMALVNVLKERFSMKLKSFDPSFSAETGSKKLGKMINGL
jgi:ParB family chromosome partitioning protein